MNPTVFDYRMARGEAIAKVESNIRRIDETEYRVKSQSGNGEYRVLATESGWVCSCPDATYRGLDCKHIFAVKFSVQIRNQVQNTTLAPIEATDACIFCGSKHIVKDGLRHNKAGDIQKFNCLECKRYFTVNLGFERMKHNPKAITTAMQLYFSGESLRNTQKTLRLLGVEVSHKTVWNWIQKYVGLMDKHLEKITPQVSDTWRADEIFLKVRGSQKYLYAMMDDETRFWIAQEVAETKYTHDLRGLFRDAKETAGKTPKLLITDAAQNFHKAYQYEYWARRKDIRTEHFAKATLHGNHTNNKMERMNGEFRDREKVMRGVKTTDSPILKGIQLYHNFIRPHQGLDGETPADRAGIKVEGGNKWLTLIQNASKRKVDFIEGVLT